MLARHELRLAKTRISDEELELAWRGLDSDNSGFIGVSEFSKFMRQGAPAPGPTWKEKEAERQAEKGRLVREEKLRASGRRIINADPASAEQLQELSALLNGMLDSPSAWFQMFMHIDDDASGKITYEEFAGMVREELKLGKSKLPEEKLESCWAALDADKSGFMVGEEFGAFMRRGAPEPGPTWKELLAEDQAEKGRLAREEKLKANGRRIAKVRRHSPWKLQIHGSI